MVCLSQQLRIGCFKKPWLQKWTSSRGTFSLLCHIVPSSRSHLFLSNYRGIVRRNSFWDYLIFNKVQKSLGGRVRFILTGSAPISEKVLNFLRCAFGCMVSTHTHTHTHTVATCTYIIIMSILEWTCSVISSRLLY